jgi:hypothetical protein
MQELSQAQLDEDIALIQLLHGRLGLDVATSFMYGTGNFIYLKTLNNKNILISKYIDLLYKFRVKGESTRNDVYNVLTTQDIQDIIDDSYRVLEKYNIV